jgi:hypothetical protein
MKWLAIGLVVFVVALAASPVTVGAVGALIGHHAENAQSINYISRGIHEMGAGRHRAWIRRKLDRLSRQQHL